MFAASKSGGVVSSGDPYWTSVSLLTNFENNLTFQDGSTNNIALTRNGVVNPSLNTPFTGGVGGSEYFNGSTGYVSGTTSTAAEFGTGDFTVEAFLYLTSATTYAMLFGSSGLNMYFGIAVYGVAPLYRLSAYDGTTVLEQTAGTSFTLNAWNHVAWVRSGTTFTAYLNGASVYSTTNSKNITGTTGFQVGHSPNYVPYYWTGNISNFRIVKGTAVYTSAFTPPTAPLTAITNTSLLITGTGQGMFNNATFVDQGPNALTVTATGSPVYSGLSPFGNTYAGSVLFNGSSQYLSTPSSSTLDILSGGDFTVECWFYANALAVNGGYGNNIANREGTGGVDGWEFRVQPTTIQFIYGGLGGADQAFTFSTATWYHVVAQRTGSVFNFYINGTKYTPSGYLNRTADSASPLRIGLSQASAGSASYFNGYISNLRIVKGTAVYTANFTPSTTPLTAITNTSLLVRGDTGAFYDLSNVGNPESGTGSATVTTQVKKFGNESSSFNNSTTYITAPDNTSLNMGASDFTVECWVYLNATPSASQAILSKDGKSAVSWAQYSLGVSTAKKIVAIISTTTTGSPPGSPTVLITGATTLNTGQWYFVALTRVGVNATLWVGGVSDGTSSLVPATLNTRNGSLYVGYEDGQAANNIFNGYLDDIRITKGVARYTATFTPPTATFPTGP